MESARLTFRRFHPGDLKNIRSLDSDAEVMKRTPARVPLTEEQSAARLKGWIDNGPSREPLGIWATERKDTGEFAGWFMLMPTRFPAPEIGFMLPRAQWGQGFALEGAARLIKFGFEEAKLDAIYAATDPGYMVSQNILKRLGFSKKPEPLAFDDKILKREILLDVFAIQRP